MNLKTEQEKFWAGDFGNQYIDRNNSDKLFFSKVAMWARILRSTNNVRSICEFGCNIGLNLLALKRLNPSLELSGYEINQRAVTEAEKLKIANITKATVIEKINTPVADLTFTACVLIHINPSYLNAVYENLVNNSSRYILIAEYYNPTPTTVSYRDHQDRLFKRDFAGELMERFKLNLIDYGFIYKRDNWAPQDDITWFLLEKQNK